MVFSLPRGTPPVLEEEGEGELREEEDALLAPMPTVPSRLHNSLCGP